MVKYFAWVISSQVYASLKREGVSPTYVVPAEAPRGQERSLVGACVWLIVKGVPDELVGFIKAAGIERFTDGYHKGDFLLHADLTASFRIGSPGATDGLFIEGAPISLPFGLTEIAFETHQRHLDSVRSRVQIRFTSPFVKRVEDVTFDNPPKKRDSLAKIAISLVVRHYGLDRIWAAEPATKLGAFANFAHSLVRERFGERAAAECLGYLQTHDPLNVLSETKGEPAASEKASPVSGRMIDIGFTEIDPESVYAREFVDAGHFVDPETALAKTEAAEKLHQDMLRDIAGYLKSRGTIPYESRSVDLMTRWGGRTNVYEIKSTNEHNLYAQAAKGSFQLAYYCEALKEDYDDLNPAMIIHKTRNESSEKRCVNVMKRLGTTCLIYDPSQAWPDRIPGLSEHGG